MIHKRKIVFLGLFSHFSLLYATHSEFNLSNEEITIYCQKLLDQRFEDTIDNMKSTNYGKKVTFFITYSWDPKIPKREFVRNEGCFKNSQETFGAQFEYYYKFSDWFESCLDKAGLHTYYDRRKDDRGKEVSVNQELFMKKAEKSQYVSVIYVPDYKLKSEDKETEISQEDSIISCKAKYDPNNYIPILLDGTDSESIPMEISRDICIYDFRNKKEYQERILEIISMIFPEQRVSFNAFITYKNQLFSVANLPIITYMYFEQKHLAAAASEQERFNFISLLYGDSRKINEKIGAVKDIIIQKECIPITRTIPQVIDFYADKYKGCTLVSDDKSAGALKTLNSSERYTPKFLSENDSRIYIPDLSSEIAGNIIENHLMDITQSYFNIWIKVYNENKYSNIEAPLVGRTTSFSTFLHESLQNYSFDVIIWINGQTKKAISDCLDIVFDSFSINHNQTQTNKLKELENKLDKYKKWLIIYDNVPYKIFLAGCMPDPRLKGSIIITSKTKTSPSLLTLYTFQPKNSISYMYKLNKSQPRAAETENLLARIVRIREIAEFTVIKLFEKGYDSRTRYFREYKA